MYVFKIIIKTINYISLGLIGYMMYQLSEAWKWLRSKKSQLVTCLHNHTLAVVGSRAGTPTQMSCQSKWLPGQMAHVVCWEMRHITFLRLKHVKASVIVQTPPWWSPSTQP